MKTRSTNSKLKPQSPWVLGAVLFLVALLVRVLFWRASEDSAWSYSVYYKGDALFWLNWAKALMDGRLYDAGLPFRPPFTAHFVAAFWNGEAGGIAALKFLWCLLGALAVLLMYGVALRSFGPRVALITGGLGAASSGLMILSTSLNNEVLYLVWVFAALWLHQSLLTRPRLLIFALYGVVHAMACLTRAEHLLFFLLLLGHLWWDWLRRQRDSTTFLQWTARLGLVLAVFSAVLVPWHVKSWTKISSFNRVEQVMNAPLLTDLRNKIGNRARGLVWEPAATRRLQSYPGFCRPMNRSIVDAIALHRGESKVQVADLDVIEQLFGYEPRPMNEHPFITFYGPLNFYLANNPQANGGFSRDPITRPLVVQNVDERYPPYLFEGLPPEVMKFDYPPHLHMFNEGYSLALQWMIENPGDYLKLLGTKLANFWSGAAVRFTGFGFPLGMSGVRRKVDLVAPESGVLNSGFSLLCFAVAAIGWWSARGNRFLAPWLLFLLTRFVITGMFFGYARHGVFVLPVLFLGLALVGEMIWSRKATVKPEHGAKRGHAESPSVSRRAAMVALAIMGAVVLTEAVRAAIGVELKIDGQSITDGDPVDPNHYGVFQIEVD